MNIYNNAGTIVCRCVCVCVGGRYLGSSALFWSASSSESSSHDSCTICCTRFSYSRLFSRNSWAASLLAGLLGFGSCKSDLKEVRLALVQLRTGEGRVLLLLFL